MFKKKITTYKSTIRFSGSSLLARSNTMIRIACMVLQSSSARCHLPRASKPSARDQLDRGPCSSATRRPPIDALSAPAAVQPRVQPLPAAAIPLRPQEAREEARDVRLPRPSPPQPPCSRASSRSAPPPAAAIPLRPQEARDEALLLCRGPSVLLRDTRVDHHRHHRCVARGS
jgi:hypothetical protein